MVHAQTVLDGLATALSTSDRLPDVTTFASIELDHDGAHSNVEVPVVELTLESLRRDGNRNTEFVEWDTDSNGNRIGRIYRSKFELDARIDCLSAEDSSYDARTMGQAARSALVEYDTRQIGEPLPHPEDGNDPLYEVSPVMVGDGSRPSDLSKTPALRITRMPVTCWFSDSYSSVDYLGPQDYVKDVTGPDPDTTIQ